MITLECEYCGKEFERYPSTIKNHVFCCKSHSAKYKKSKGLLVRPRKRTKFNCLNCGKEVERVPSKTGKRVFCCYDCWIQYRQSNGCMYNGKKIPPGYIKEAREMLQRDDRNDQEIATGQCIMASRKKV